MVKNRKIVNQRLANPSDARAVRSREALRAALLTLIKDRPLEQITIQDITDQAGVSYPTFFRQFASKEQILEDIAQAEIRQLLSLTMPLFDADQQEQSLRALCDYVNNNRSLWTSLLTAGAASAMREEFIRLAEEIAVARDRTGERANPWLPIDLAGRFVVSGIFEILSWWMRQPKNYPVENIIKLLDVLVVRSTARPLDVTLT